MLNLYDAVVQAAQIFNLNKAKLFIFDFVRKCGNFNSDLLHNTWYSRQDEKYWVLTGVSYTCAVLFRYDQLSIENVKFCLLSTVY